MENDWSKVKVVDLRAELKRRGLPQAGLKQELVDRLTAADAEAASAAQQQGEPETDDPADEPPREASPAPEVARPTEEAQAEPATSGEPADAPSSAPSPAPGADATERGASEDARSTSADVRQDAQKRKRRSSTPDPSAKRARQTEQPEDIVDFETSDIVGNGHDGGDGDPEEPEAGADGAGSTAPASVEEAAEKPRDHDEETNGQPEGAEPTKGEASRMETERPWDERLAAQARSQPRRADEPAAGGRGDDGVVEPSVHAATPALYIKNFMRPLRAPEVRDHLAALATPPGSSRDPDVIEDFFLDQIRTHALVRFRTVAAASRVRTGLHGRVWPDERNRKALWVDFIPPDKVREWADAELAAGRGASRWEVVYDPTEGGVAARLAEAGLDTRAPRAPTGPAPKPPVPTGPSRPYPGVEAAPLGPRASRGRFGNDPPGADARARLTRAGPSIRYLPVDEDLARRRIDNMHAHVAKGPRRDLGPASDINRYTFESQFAFVDRGREVFIGIRPPHREREKRERERQGRALGGARPGGGRPGDGADRRRDDLARPPPRPPMTDEDRYPQAEQRPSQGSVDDRGPRYDDYRLDRPRDRYQESYRGGRY